MQRGGPGSKTRDEGGGVRTLLVALTLLGRASTLDQKAEIHFLEYDWALNDAKH
jgi:hypothetical protein